MMQKIKKAIKFDPKAQPMTLHTCWRPKSQCRNMGQEYKIGMELLGIEIKKHRLAKEFKEAEHELHQFSLEGEV